MVELSLVRKRVFGPHLRDHGNRFFPLRPGFIRVDLKPVHLNERGGTPGAQVHPAIAHNVQYRGPFGHPHRVVVLAGQQGHRVPDANPLGALRQGAVEHLWCRAVGEFPQKMVLDRPEVIEPDFVRELDLGHDLSVTLLLDALVVGLGNLNFVHQSEFHISVLLAGVLCLHGTAPTRTIPHEMVVG